MFRKVLFLIAMGAVFMMLGTSIFASQTNKKVDAKDTTTIVLPGITKGEPSPAPIGNKVSGKLSSVIRVKQYILVEIKDGTHLKAFYTKAGSRADKSLKKLNQGDFVSVNFDSNNYKKFLNFKAYLLTDIHKTGEVHILN